MRRLGYKCSENRILEIKGQLKEGKLENTEMQAMELA
jgi:hypothetical protein